MSRPETFLTYQNYVDFKQCNCRGCVKNRDTGDCEFGIIANACIILKYFEIERFTDLSNRQAAYIDRTIIDGVCQKRTTTKPRKYPKRPISGQESLL